MKLPLKYNKNELIDMLLGRARPSKIAVYVYKMCSSGVAEEPELDFAINQLIKLQEVDDRALIELIDSPDICSMVKYKLIRELRKFESPEVFALLGGFAVEPNYDLRRAALYTAVEIAGHPSTSCLDQCLKIVYELILYGGLDSLDYLMVAKNLSHIKTEKVDDIMSHFPSFNQDALGVNELYNLFRERGISLKYTQI